MFGYNLSEYELKCVIKETSTAVIHLAKWRLDNSFKVIKQIAVDRQDEVNLQLAENEVNSMRQLLHPHILVVSAAFVQAADIYVVYPLLRYGSCQDVMDRFCCVGFPEIIVSLIVRDVLLALEYLHNKCYIHRSIRASHILLGDRAVLTGFKECVSLVVDGKRINKMHDLPASPKELVWLAPEVLEQNLLGYTERSDIYSVGITLCELGNNLTPFSEMSRTLMLVEKVRGNAPALLDCSTYTAEMMGGLENEEIEQFAQATRQVYSQRKLSDPFHNFVEICLHRDPAKRPLANKLLHHPFIRQAKHTTLRTEMEELKIDSIDTIVPPNASEDGMILASTLGDMKINDDDEFCWNF